MEKDAFSPLNLGYIEELYGQWKRDRGSVHEGWDELFRALDESDDVRLHQTPVPRRTSAEPLTAESAPSDLAYKQSRFSSLLWAYRDVGYLYARLNPLVGYLSADLHFLYDQEENLYERLTLREFGLGDEDLDLVLSAGRYLKPQKAPLREHLKALQEIYCSTIGIEVLHIQNRKIRSWIIEKVETSRGRSDLSLERKKRIFEDLTKAEEFEQFLHTTFIGQKRFSLEGAEVLIPALHHLVDEAVDLGMEEIVLGMSHRGRLNVLANIMNKSALEILTEFEDVHHTDLYGGSGDVKHHRGYRCDHVNSDGRRVHINLVSNPSHLESVDPVVEGVARGVQHRKDDRDRRKVIPVLIHGDAAFSGQGVVPETLNLSRLRGYSTGGTVHFIVNNQIGFTTSTKDARSTFFPTDVAKMLPIPVFHVNGDDPEAAVRVTDLALKFRQEFARDVIVDIFCYRRHGHNEGDEPSFTHPKMYQFIRYHEGAARRYGDALEQQKVTSRQDRDRFVGDYRAFLREQLAQSRQATANEPPVSTPPTPPVRPQVSRESSTDANESPRVKKGEPDTSAPAALLSPILETLVSVPDGFHIHPKLERIVKDREKNYKEDDRIDFPLAESLAFGTLLLEGVHVRLSGEDSARGTFSQRHSVWWDMESDKPLSYVPLNNIAPDQAIFSVYDSPLSEFSVLGFEYGFSLAVPKALVLWEAQFGDFSNGAQVIIDNFIVSGEAKWGNESGLVMLLPHGYEGQGPDHSSAHLERFLQLCAEHNIRVCTVTSPAQYFHLLRRQAKGEPKKPLIIMTPKSLLRHPGAVSSLTSFTEGKFSEIIEDPPDGEASALCFCAGKIYYELRGEKEKAGSRGVKLVRIEQLHPFPQAEIESVMNRERDVRKIWWVQEEPCNRGAWSFMRDRFSRFKDGRELTYIGRGESASTATGSHGRHAREQEAIVRAVFETGQAERGKTARGRGNSARKRGKPAPNIKNGIRSTYETGDRRTVGG